MVLQNFDPRDVSPHSMAPVYAEGVIPPVRLPTPLPCPVLTSALSLVHGLEPTFTQQ
jgi:hypothetical protein